MANSSRILLAFDNVGAEYVSRIKEGAMRAVNASGYSLDCENLYGTAKQFSDILSAQEYAGIILTPPLSDDRHELLQAEALGVPVVRIAPMLDLERGSTVIMDEYNAARAVTQILLDNGHRRIGFIKGPREHLVSIRRFNGFANALGGSAQRVDQNLIVQGDFSRESGFEQAEHLFSKDVTAIFASNDEMALGVLDAASKRGLSVPDDLSLVGFDGNSAATRCSPPLTTVRQPLEAMGDAAVRILSAQLGGGGRGKVNEDVPFSIMEGESVADYSAPLTG